MSGLCGSQLKPRGPPRRHRASRWPGDCDATRKARGRCFLIPADGGLPVPLVETQHTPEIRGHLASAKGEGRWGNAS